MDAVLLQPLDALESSLNALITSLTTTQTFSNAPTATKALLSADDALKAALTTLHQHQSNFARILNLQEEATRLQDQIKSVVRTCGQYREEIGGIHPSILDASDSDDDDETVKPQEVDYKTLLAFAARIGKHNAVAAREAEQETVKRRKEIQRKATQTPNSANGGVNPTAAASAIGLPEESQNDLNFLNAQVAADRAAKGMAFPAADVLRLGALGQLQRIREEGGENAVEEHIKQMIKDAESGDVQIPDRSQQSEPAEKDMLPRPSLSRPIARPSQATPQTASAGPPKKLNLDLWDDDDDDDD